MAFWLPELVAAVFVIAVLVGLRWMIHRSLAPERIVETRTPIDVGLQFQDVTISTENGKTLFGWYVGANRPGRGPVAVLLHGW